MSGTRGEKKISEKPYKSAGKMCFTSLLEGAGGYSQ